MDDRTYKHIERWSNILAKWAIPLVVAAFGWGIQNAISENGIKRDYVQIAAQILSSKDQDPDLRRWATHLIDANSPVPLSASLQSGLANGSIIVMPPRLPIPRDFLTSPLMAAPMSWKELPSRGSVTYGDVMKNYIENRGIFQQNAIMLQYLQDSIRGMAEVSPPPIATSVPTQVTARP